MGKRQKNTRKQSAGADSTAGSNNPSGSGNNVAGSSSSGSASKTPGTAPSGSSSSPQQQQNQQPQPNNQQPSDNNTSPTTGTNSSSNSNRTYETLWEWIHAEREGLFWVLGCAAIGFLLGFGVGCGWFTGGSGSYSFVETEQSAGNRRVEGSINMRRSYVVAPWRTALASRIRRTSLYEVSTFRKAPWTPFAEVVFGTGAAEDCAWNGGGGAGGGGGMAQTPPQSQPLASATMDSSPYDSAPGSSSANPSTSLPGATTTPPTQLVPDGNWITRSLVWPPNWMLFKVIDVAQIDVGEGGFSPLAASALSILLPWRRDLIRSLRKNHVDPSMVGAYPPPHLLSGAPVDPQSHPLAFQALREHVVRQDGGYVHPDLGWLVPAPSGALRGLGMVRDTYGACQTKCHAGSAEEVRAMRAVAQKEEEARGRRDFERKRLHRLVEEKLPHLLGDEEATTATQRPLVPGLDGSMQELPEEGKEGNELKRMFQKGEGGGCSDHRDGFNVTNYNDVRDALHRQSVSERKYSQEEVLLRIPLHAQITRSAALLTLDAVIPPDIKRRSPLPDLDDAALLALLLAHERALGPDSRWWPYIATLPRVPSCAFNPAHRQAVVDVVTAASVEMGTDVQGWPSELSKAAEYAERIASALARDYGPYLGRPGGNGVGGVPPNGNGNGNSAYGANMESIRWALCQVSSRAVAGRERYGALRLVAVMDMINHDVAAGKFVELEGNETIDTGWFLDATEDDSGAFVVRSMRHGQRKPLRKGQELLANYNVPAYSPLDWFLNMGYIPPERGGKWTMLEAALPRVRTGGFSREMPSVTSTGAFGSGKPEIQVIRQRLIP